MRVVIGSVMQIQVDATISNATPVPALRKPEGSARRAVVAVVTIAHDGGLNDVLSRRTFLASLARRATIKRRHKHIYFSLGMQRRLRAIMIMALCSSSQSHTYIHRTRRRVTRTPRLRGFNDLSVLTYLSRVLGQATTAYSPYVYVCV